MSSNEEMISTFHRIATEVAERTFPPFKSDTVIADLGLDSLHVLEIVGSMEREFGVQIPDDQLVGIQTVADLVKLLQRQQSK